MERPGVVGSTLGNVVRCAVAEVQDKEVDRENRGNGCGVRSVASLFLLQPQQKKSPSSLGGGRGRGTIESLSAC